MSRLFFVSDRTDGLGERLRSIVNAIYLANAYSGVFVFEWKLREGRKVAFNSICDIHEVFSDDFIEAHSYSKHSQALEVAEELPIERTEEAVDSRTSTQTYKITTTQLPLYRYLPSLKADLLGGGYQKAFDSIIFSANASHAISDARSLNIPDGSVAVHLRAGDIIDGIYNKTARFCEKAIPYQMADKVLESLVSSGHPVLLFGQDPKLIDYLSRKYGVISASTLPLRPSSSMTHTALAEVVLMSRCKQIVSGSSGFAVFASYLAGKERVPFGRVLSESDCSLIIKSIGESTDDAISVEQRVFSLRWAIGKHLQSLTVNQVHDLCQAGLTLIRDDPFFSIVLASSLVAGGNNQRAKELLDHVVSHNSPSFVKRLLHPSSFGEKKTATLVLDLINPILPDAAKEYLMSKETSASF